MAQFIGYVKGSRGEASRLGGKDSGIRAQAQGWNAGVKVIGRVNTSGEDEFSIFITGGSSPSFSDYLLGTVGKDGTFELSDSIAERTADELNVILSNR